MHNYPVPTTMITKDFWDIFLLSVVVPKKLFMFDPIAELRRSNHEGLTLSTESLIGIAKRAMTFAATETECERAF